MSILELNARRTALLHEVAAVASRYEQDIARGDDDMAREGDLDEALISLWQAASPDRRKAAYLEIAGRAFAGIERLVARQATS